MARTKRGSKPAGYDYWSRRPFSSLGYGPDIKHMTRKTERAQAKEQLHRELKELD